MSQSINKEEFAENICKAASKAAIDKSVSNLVVMRKVKSKRLDGEGTLMSTRIPSNCWKLLE